MRTKNKFLMLCFALIIPLIACTFPVLQGSDPTATPIIPALATSTINLPTPTIPPTPLPGARIEKGDLAYFNGDWDRAIFEYTFALENSNDNEIKIAALLGLGKTHYQSGDPEKALTSLIAAQEQGQDSPLQASIYFALGQVYEELDQDQEAINAFISYADFRPGLIDNYVFERMGDIQFSMEDYQGAINSYIQALQSPTLGDKLLVNIKIGDAYEALGDIATSLVTYQDIYEQTRNEYIKAQMQYYIGYANIILGNTSEGYAAYQFAVGNYPTAYFTLLSLNELLNNEFPVDDYTQAIIYYYAGYYDSAGKAFYRYLNATPAHDDSAHYYYGLALQKSFQYEAAIEQFTEIVDEHRNQPHWADAIDEIAYIQWYFLDNYDAAIETIETFVNSNDSHAQCPELLYYAGRIAERNYDLKKAAQLWERLGLTYSTSSYAYDGLFQAGIAKFRLHKYQEAIDLFFSSLGLVREPEHQARAYFWIGKSYTALESYGNAQSAWIQAIDSDPTGYYSERSSEIMNGISAFQPIPNNLLAVDLETEQEEAETWLRLIFSIPQETQIDDLTYLMADLRFSRGTEFLQLGLYNQARIEFESLRSDFSQDPLNSYRLANHLIELGLYRSGIYAARQVLDLAGLDDAGTLEAPIYFNHLRFGLYYSDLVIPAAESYNMDPLLLFSAMRQESLFEGFVTSSVGARGLMQVMPATGESLYNISGWPIDYTDQDLYRPLVSVTYGARYLSNYRNSNNGSIAIALASYNAGPGNATAWIQYADGDPDLYLEVIRYAETRDYLRGIFEQYAIYKNLYHAAE